MSFFSTSEIHVPGSVISYRTEFATGISSRISPFRGTRGINAGATRPTHHDNDPECPFCREQIFTSTSGFSDGTWIESGESVTFPNLYPFADRHTVTVITEAHMVESFSPRQLSDALIGSAKSLMDHPGYPSIHWNFLPSAGASMLHPHMQGMADNRPVSLCADYLLASAQTASGDYWKCVREEEEDGPRHLFGDEIFWYASPVPIGECEIRGILPIRTLEDIFTMTDTLGRDIRRVIDLYRSFGLYAFNMGIFFQKNGHFAHDGMCAFCTMIARINPNPKSISDSAFMERICREPVVMTLPEDIRKNIGL